MTDTAYATWAQLQEAVNDDPALTQARGQELLNQVAAQVDAALLAAGYPIVPATGANDVRLIGQFVVNMAAAQAHRELYQEAEAPERVTAWERQFERFLNGIATGKVRLPDQAAESGAGGLTVGRVRFTRVQSSSEWDV